MTEVKKQCISSTATHPILRPHFSLNQAEEWIGSPPGQMDPKAFLLQKFNVTARQRVSSWFTVKCTFGSSCNENFNLVPMIDEALQEGIDALKLLLSKSLAESAKRFNKEQKYKHLRVQNIP
ncbi:Peptidyl-tRNA hydrolase, mitochondrial, partial [Mucuna pruriens]